jgi:MFS family permease
LGISAAFVRETRGYAHLEAETHRNADAGEHGALSNREIFTRTTFTEPALSSASQAGLVNNLNFGLSWGLFPILFASTGTPIERIGLLIATYPAVWGAGQILTGALSDKWGRKHLITAGMLTQAVALGLIAIGDTFTWWLLASALLGAGTAMVYPTLLAAIGDVAHPLWRARAVGVYRLWRDSGYAAGAIVGGVAADFWGLRAAVWAAAAITVVSGLVVAARMYETHMRVPPQGTS